MVDQVIIDVSGGRGGAGCVSFHREKFRPKGPPDGGDGGCGGDIVLVGDPNLTTLADFHSRSHFQAQDGERGGPNNRHGKNGVLLEIRVPLGTEVVAVDRESAILGEILIPSERLLVAKGGLGGKGNARFKSSRQRSPQISEPGGEGEHRKIQLDLKIIADIGLIGLPNAGKSTLLNAMTRASSPVAAYPFTTLEPHLGVINYKDQELKLKNYTVADIPGLIEGASTGKGLGDQFLRHVERTSLLVHLIDPTSSRSLLQDYEVIRRELEEYSPELGSKEEVVVFTKMDLPLAPERLSELRNLSKVLKGRGVEVCELSAQSGVGVADLISLLQRSRSRHHSVSSNSTFPVVTKNLPCYRLEDLPNKRIIKSVP